MKNLTIQSYNLSVLDENGEDDGAVDSFVTAQVDGVPVVNAKFNDLVGYVRDIDRFTDRNIFPTHTAAIGSAVGGLISYDEDFIVNQSGARLGLRP